MKTELDALLALAASRRAAGLPCNPWRDGLSDVDWLSKAQIDYVFYLQIRLELSARTGVA